MSKGDLDEYVPVSPSFRLPLCGTFRAERRVGERYKAIQTAEWGCGSIRSNYPRLPFKALLCCPGRQARREALLDMLWPEVDPEQASQNLNAATIQLRAGRRTVKEQESLLLTAQDASAYRLTSNSSGWTRMQG